jgi:hypothetical protein
MNAAGEAQPLFYVVDPSAKIQCSFRVKVEWFEDLPTITWLFGCPTQVECAMQSGLGNRRMMDSRNNTLMLL